jgi:hypothetical protein
MESFTNHYKIAVNGINLIIEFKPQRGKILVEKVIADPLTPEG